MLAVEKRLPEEFTPFSFERESELSLESEFGGNDFGRPNLNLALLYLLILVGTGLWIARDRLWEQRLLSPTTDRLFEEGVASIKLPELSISKANRVSHTVRSGEDFPKLFQRFGLDAEESPKIVAAVKELEAKLSQRLFPRPGRKVVFRLNASGTFERLSYPVTKDKEIQVTSKRTASGREFKAKLIEHPPLELQVVAQGEILTSFASAASKAKVPYDVIDDIADLFGDRVDFRRDFKKGDRFTLIYRQQMAKGSATSGPIIAAVFEIDGKQIYALRYVGSDGKARYFDQNGRVLGDSFLRFPVQFSKISSLFSEARFHPALRIKRPHNGVDFAAPTGTSVRTVGDGQVVFAGYKGPSGNMVRIRHNDRYTTEYLHLSKITPGIKRGAIVGKGDLIGNVGSTGLSTGPHLHYGLFDRGKYIDPMRANLSFEESLGRGKAIDKRYLSGLLTTLARYQTEELEGSSARTVSVVEKKRG